MAPEGNADGCAWQVLRLCTRSLDLQPVDILFTSTSKFHVLLFLTSLFRLPSVAAAVGCAGRAKSHPNDGEGGLPSTMTGGSRRKTTAILGPQVARTLESDMFDLAMKLLVTSRRLNDTCSGRR